MDVRGGSTFHLVAALRKVEPQSVGVLPLPIWPYCIPQGTDG